MKKITKFKINDIVIAKPFLAYKILEIKKESLDVIYIGYFDKKSNKIIYSPKTKNQHIFRNQDISIFILHKSEKITKRKINFKDNINLVNL